VKRLAKLMLLILAVALVLKATQPQSNQKSSLGEQLVPAMKDYERIKPGLPRGNWKNSCNAMAAFNPPTQHDMSSRFAACCTWTWNLSLRESRDAFSRPTT